MHPVIVVTLLTNDLVDLLGIPWLYLIALMGATETPELCQRTSDK